MNDLAVAWLATAEREQQLRPLLKGLDLVERALAANEKSLPALFNRALLLERLFVLAGAETAWVRYQRAEHDPRWRKEASAHLQSVRRRMSDATTADLGELFVTGAPPGPRRVADYVRMSPQGARESATPLLRMWGMSILRGDSTRAVELITIVRDIGSVLGSVNGDESVEMETRAIDLLATRQKQLRRLALAHVQLASGIALYSTAAFDDAAERLRIAEATFRRLHSPAARWAAFYRGAAEVNRGRYAVADRLFDQILRESTTAEPALLGKAIWAHGVSRLRRGDYDGATRFYRDARPFMVRARETENLGAISYLLAESLALSGQTAAGADEALSGLRLLSPFRRSEYLNNHLTTVAAYARADGLPHAALALMNEVLEVARATQKAQTIAWALRARARDLLELGRVSDADLDLQAAKDWVTRTPRGRGHDRVIADVALVQARLMLDRQPREARRLLATVEQTYRELALDGLLPEALYELALAARRDGDAPEARHRLDTAIQGIEHQNSLFVSIQSRAQFEETLERVFDQMIEWQIDAGDAHAAFDYLERARIATWSDAHNHGRVRVARYSLEAAQQLLPDSTVLVEYAVLANRIVIWTASRHHWEFHVSTVTRDSLATLVTRLEDESARSIDDQRPANALLFDLLLGPVDSLLRNVTRLVVVPDRELNRVPFAALWDHKRKEFVIERYEIRTIPSASFLVLAMPMKMAGGRVASAFVVGNPTPVATSRSQLPPLPGATREAESIATLYARAEVLKGAEARRRSVLQRLPKYQVFHFAGHAVVDAERPELSYLAFAAEAGDDGILRAAEIGRLRLSNVRIAVLSACGSLGPRPTRTGTLAGLAYAFLRAGAPATISSVWDVTDQTTSELLREFHRRFARGESAPHALQQAQLTALRQPISSALRAPRVWAAFIYTGP